MNRRIEDCPYRRVEVGSSSPPGEAPREPGSDTGATCALVGEVLGAADPRLGSATLEQCAACCRQAAPSPGELNPMVASLVIGAAVRVIEAGGVEGCDVARAEAERDRAVGRLEWGGQPPGEPGPQVPPYTGPCFYLGGGVGGENNAANPAPGTGAASGANVRYNCGHERHGETTRAACLKCIDYEPPPGVGRVGRWAVAVTTAPRREPTLAQTLESLAAAGWGTGVRVFAEPGTDLAPAVSGGTGPGLVLTCRPERLGAWPNWYLALGELVLREPEAHAYLMCQDDVLFGRGLRAYLERALWPAGRPGVVSLHTASHQRRTGGRRGFFAADLGWSAWGAQALVFPNAAARALLRHPDVVNHRARGIGEGLRNIDSVVGQWCRSAGFDYFLHAPSLTQHIGDTSTLWGEDVRATGRRRAADFIGEDNEIPAGGPDPPAAGPPGPPPDTRPSPMDTRPAAPAGGRRPAGVCPGTGVGVVVNAVGARGALAEICLATVEAQVVPPDRRVLVLAAGDDPRPWAAGGWTVAAAGPGADPWAAGVAALGGGVEWAVTVEPPCRLGPSYVETLCAGLPAAGPAVGWLLPSSAGAAAGRVPPLVPGSGLTLRRVAFEESGGSFDRMAALGWRGAPLEADLTRGGGTLFAGRRGGDESLAIVSVLIGRRGAFPRWREWLLNADLPPGIGPVALYLVDNSGDPIFGGQVRVALHELLSSGRFETVALNHGPGPAKGVPRLSVERCQNIAHAFNRVLPRVRESLVLTLDDDTVPPPGALVELVGSFRELARRGVAAGAVSGCCESASAPGFLAVSRSRRRWGDRPRVGEIAAGETEEVGFVGTACCLLDGAALARVLPLRWSRGGDGQVEGPDVVLCRALRGLGYSVWVHGGVVCDHLLGAAADTPPVFARA